MEVCVLNSEYVKAQTELSASDYHPSAGVTSLILQSWACGAVGKIMKMKIIIKKTPHREFNHTSAPGGHFYGLTISFVNVFVCLLYSETFYSMPVVQHF